MYVIECNLYVIGMSRLSLSIIEKEIERLALCTTSYSTASVIKMEEIKIL